MALRLPRFLRSIPLVENNGTPTLAFHQWWDTTLKQIEKSVLDIQTALTAAGIALDGVGFFPSFSTRTITTDTTLTSSDYLVLVDATAGNVIVTLPASDTKEGYQIIVKKIDVSVNTVTIEPDGSETIDGAANKVLTTQFEVVRTASDGATWWVV